MRKMDEIQKIRIGALNSRGPNLGEYILYWMQSSARTEYNHALEYPVELYATTYHDYWSCFV